MESIDGPFIGSEARRAGIVTKRTLRSRHEMIYRNVYVPKGLEITAASRAKAAWLWSGRNATVAGLSAAALLGTRWIDGTLPAELIRRQACDVEGIAIHRDTLRVGETCTVGGIPTTTPARTAFELGRRGTLNTAVIRLDALANATGLQPVEITRLGDRHHGSRGLVQLRQAVDLMDAGAESPQETRTRLLLVRAGLPKPTTQIVVCDDFGMVYARIDMGWEEWKVGVEYDGTQHWTDPAQRTRDIDRYAKLTADGWLIVRVSSELLKYRPHVILERVCAALQSVGCPWPVECGLETRLSLRSVA